MGESVSLIILSCRRFFVHNTYCACTGLIRPFKTLRCALEVVLPDADWNTWQSFDSCVLYGHAKRRKAVAIRKDQGLDKTTRHRMLKRNKSSYLHRSCVSNFDVCVLWKVELFYTNSKSPKSGCSGEKSDRAEDALAKITLVTFFVEYARSVYKATQYFQRNCY